jgi:hypothetical protein
VGVLKRPALKVDEWVWTPGGLARIVGFEQRVYWVGFRPSRVVYVDVTLVDGTRRAYRPAELELQP